MMTRLKSALIALSVFVITGFVFSGSANASCESGEQRTTTAGAVFTCDTSSPSLGEAWRDPSGLIWGDVKKTDGVVYYMNHSEATNYCTLIGARLPSKEEFTRLQEYMWAEYTGYSPQVLPDLSGNQFWSSSAVPNWAVLAYSFNGDDGILYNSHRSYVYTAVRCVVGP